MVSNTECLRNVNNSVGSRRQYVDLVSLEYLASWEATIAGLPNCFQVDPDGSMMPVHGVHTKMLSYIYIMRAKIINVAS